MPGPGSSSLRLQESLKSLAPAAGFSVATAADWLVVLVLHFACNWIEMNVEPHQQDILQYIQDPDYRFPHVAHQHVPVDLLYGLTYYLPIAAVIVVTCARQNWLALHFGLLSFLAGYHFTWLSTEFIKLQVGRLRPDFFSRCAFDEATQACTGAHWLVQDGRVRLLLDIASLPPRHPDSLQRTSQKSFPSGHSSGGFFAGVWLLLFLASNNGALKFSDVGHSFQRAKLLRLAVAACPVFMAFFIAISRWQDHIHHPTDIMAGSILGALHAWLFYHVFWPAPWSKTQPIDQPRVVCTPRESSFGDGERQPLLGSDRP